MKSNDRALAAAAVAVACLVLYVSWHLWGWWICLHCNCQ